MKKDIETYRGKNNEGEQDILKSEIEKYETLAGYTDVEGTGIKIEINSTKDLGNSDKNDSILYNYDLLLSMINKLNSAQASAISINDQRIVSNTYMYLKEDKLYMNDTVIKEPIIIKAIGDSDTLASALNIKYGIVWEIETYYNAKVKVTKEDNIEINGHSDINKAEGNNSMKKKIVILGAFILGVFISTYIKSLDPNRVYITLGQTESIESEVENTKNKKFKRNS